MPLTQSEEQLRRTIAARKSVLLEDLTRHVALPTGHGNTEALDQTRALLTDRLRKLGAKLELIPGIPKDPWLYESGHQSAVPPTATSRRTKPGIESVLLCGHLDTVHDPKSD